MQHKHKKKRQSRPIIPKHTVPPTRTAVNGVADHQQQHGCQKVYAAHVQLHCNPLLGKSLLGKRNHSSSHDEAQGTKQQRKDLMGAVDMSGQQLNKLKLQKQSLRRQVGHKHRLSPSILQEGQEQLGNMTQQPQQQQHPPPKQQLLCTDQLRQQQVTRGGHHQQQAQQHHQQNLGRRRNKQQRTAAGVPGAPAAAVGEAAAGKPSAVDIVGAAGAPETSAAGPQAATGTTPTVDAKPWNAKQPAAISSNWQVLQQQLKQQMAAKPRRPRKHQRTGGVASAAAAQGRSGKQISAVGHNKSVTPIIAMDCEMVGVGPGGERDSLARVSIVNASGQELYDSYVAQKEPVTDYRTWVSGITPANLQGAPDISTVQEEVTQLLQGRVLVGHGLKKDLSVLMLSHPRKSIRDTAKYPPFMFSKSGKRRPRALKALAQEELGISIQEGQHSSVDDARAALYLYQKHAFVWEKALKTPQGLKQLPTANRRISKKRVESYSLRDVKNDPLADL